MSFLDAAWIENRLTKSSNHVSDDSFITKGESLEQHRKGYTDLKEALDQLPLEMKAALVEALRKCPDLAETESDPILFLRREEFNGWAAAFRLALYWKMRKECFGERAFLAVTVTDGSCALSVDDINLLRTGFRVVLPDDQQGRPVRLLSLIILFRGFYYCRYTFSC
jgi:hypothetical protein